MAKHVALELENLHIETLSNQLSYASIDIQTKIPYESKEHITLAISPCNRYYTQDTVNTLVRWVCSEFKKVTILDCSDIYKYTLEAKESKRVKNKLEKIAKDFDIKCKNALDQYLNDCSDENIDQTYQEIRNAGQRLKFWKNKIQICRVMDFQNNEAFCTSLKAVQEAFERDKFFRQTCLDFTTNKILARKKDDYNTTEVHKLVGVKYLLYELPFLINSKEIFGRPSVVFYHQPFDIFYQILNGDFPSLKVTSNSGIFVVNLHLKDNAAVEFPGKSRDYSSGDSSLLKSSKNIESFVKETKRVHRDKKITIEEEIQNYFASLGGQVIRELKYDIKKELKNTVKIEFGLPAKISMDENKINIWVEKRKSFNLMIKLYGDMNKNAYKSAVEKSFSKILGSVIFLNSDKATKINFKNTVLLYNLDTQEITEIIDNVKKTKKED